MKKPNIVLILADQMRAQATGYAGDPNVKTPYLDELSKNSINFFNTVSHCPVCTPYRGCLMSGQYPLTHGLFMNDLSLPDNGHSLAQSLKKDGYDTAYIGKWHIDGHGRRSYIPPERRQGFDYWKVLECTHDYWDSDYYENDSDEILKWEGYDAFAQTDDAVNWIDSRKDDERPFILFVSFGIPHDPYNTPPEYYKNMYKKERFLLRDNVTPELTEKCREDLLGYYAHISALDDCVKKIDRALDSKNLKDNTYFIFTSDHGDSMESHCKPDFPGINKQRPYEESIMVPLLIRGPGIQAGNEKTLITSPDLMPTILGLCKVEIPDIVEGLDYSSFLLKRQKIYRKAVLIASYSPFANWSYEKGGREYRGIRTEQYTYVRDLQGPWLLFDNMADPFQLNNLVDNSEYLDLKFTMDALLDKELNTRNDTFLQSRELRKIWNYEVDEAGAIPYTD